MNNLLYNYGYTQPATQPGMPIILLVVLIVLALAVEIYLVCFAVRHAKLHDKNHIAWGIFTFIFSLFAIILLYIEISSSQICRSKYAWVCKECGTVNYFNKRCTSCATQKTTAKQVVENKVKKAEPKQNWICPKCGQSNNPNAKKCINCLHEKI